MRPVPANTPTLSADGQRLARLGPLSQPRAAPPALANAIRVSSNMVASHESVGPAELVKAWLTRGAPRSDALYERFVRVLSIPLMEPPSNTSADKSGPRKLVGLIPGLDQVHQ